MNRAAVRRTFVVVLVLLPILVVMGLLHRQEVAVSATVNPVVATITFPANPTPWPTVDMRHVTPVPTLSAPPTAPVVTPPNNDQQPIDPDEPLYLIMTGIRHPDTRISVNESTAIITGRVEEVFPARWSTPDGRRPADVRANNYQEAIYTPIRIRVEQSFLQYVPGEDVIVYALGGIIDRDQMVYTSDDLFSFRLGEQVIVFIEDVGRKIDGNPLLQVRERYSISPEGLAYNSLRQLPLQELVQEIQASLASPLTIATSIPGSFPTAMSTPTPTRET